MSAAAVSVVIPTIGRPEQLADCLRSLSACNPPAGEIVIVDQSGDTLVANAVAELGQSVARVVPCRERGIARAMNLGLQEARHELVLVTHDDCTVAESWIGTGSSLIASDREAVFTGRVLPLGDPKRVPSTNDDPLPRDYTGQIRPGVLYPNNMALNRTEVLAGGGFDERFRTAAEDLDFCYRWLKSGRTLRYVPELLVWHKDWRSDEDLRKLHLRYWHGLGMFYGKHARLRDRMIAPLMLETLNGALRGWLARLLEGASRRPEHPRGFGAALAVGFRDGWHMASTRHRAEGPA